MVGYVLARVGTCTHASGIFARLELPFLVYKVTKGAVLFLNYMQKALCSVWRGEGVTQVTQPITEYRQR